MHIIRATLVAAAASVLLAAPAAPAAPQGLAGNYLAARAAKYDNNYRKAAEYYTMALIGDRDNPRLMENATLAYLGLGEIDKAVPVARRLDAVMPGNQISAMAIYAHELKKGPNEAIAAELRAGGRIGPLVDGLLLGWAELQLGRADEGLRAFDALIASDEYRNFGLFHKALALAQMGDFERAEAILSGEAEGPLTQTRRGLLALAQIQSQLGRGAEAARSLGENFDLREPVVADLVARLSTGAAVPFDLVTSPTEGMGEVFFSIAGALNGQAEDNFTLLYARLAEYLAPGNVDAILLSASLLEDMEQYTLATATYDQVPRNHPAFMNAEIGRAEALGKAGRNDAAIEVLTQLAELYPEVPSVHATLGDTLRRVEDFEAATRAYDRALALYEEPLPENWFLYYVRGITNERIDNWDRAEADFRTALDLNPGHPSVLNYLGYSLVEKRLKLDEALEMIRQAVEARPDSAYITDSLGWVLYRLGRFDEAVEPMERSVSLLPVDPIINDHLGDVYWAVGRYREAEFQWTRAMSFDPEPEDAERIRRKLEVGLDQVLREEGAPSLKEKAEAAAARLMAESDDG